MPSRCGLAGHWESRMRTERSVRCRSSSAVVVAVLILVAARNCQSRTWQSLSDRRQYVQRMRIVIPGGSGQVGTVLARAFSRDGHDVVVLSRRPQPAPWRVVQWDAETVGAWASELEGADVVDQPRRTQRELPVHDGEPRRNLESRVRSTRRWAEALRACVTPPPVWLQASTATIYAHRFDAANDERTGHHRRYGAGVPRDGVSASRWRRPGKRPARIPRRANAIGVDAYVDADEPRPRRDLCHASAAGAPAARWAGGRRPAIRVVDSRTATSCALCIG